MDRSYHEGPIPANAAQFSTEAPAVRRRRGDKNTVEPTKRTVLPSQADSYLAARTEREAGGDDSELHIVAGPNAEMRRKRIRHTHGRGPKTIRLMYAASCLLCRTELAVGTLVNWYGVGRIAGLKCCLLRHKEGD